MEDTNTWLMFACIAVWVGIGGYVFYLGRKQAELQNRLDQLEQLQDN